MLNVKNNLKEIKYQKLQELREKLEFIVEGLDNHPEDNRPIYYFANHSRLMDIFYLSAAVPTNQVVVVSNRLVYKPIVDKQQTINKYLYTMPLELATKAYTDISMNATANLLEKGINVSIFPEGVYNDGTVITRGRTGMARILFEACKRGVRPYLVPIAIHTETDDTALDRYKPCPDDKVTVKILEPLNYEYLIPEYLKSDNFQEKNEILHMITDIGMQNIATALGIPFTGKYKMAIPKDKIMFQDGSTISLEEGNLEKNYNRFSSEIENRTKRLLRVLK